jgi:hypothetical protein
MTATLDIIEAAARALRDSAGIVFDDGGRYAARTVLATVTPLIRAADVKLIEENVADLVAMTKAAALERAAKVAEERERRERDNDGEDVYIEACRDIAAGIRALKVATPPPPDDSA